MTLQWLDGDDDTVTAEQDGSTWVLRRRAAPDDHPRVGRCWYLHLALEGGLTIERLPMSHDLARAKREAKVTISYDADNVRALLGTKVETCDDSNSSRLNRLSVERLRERFGDALPAEGTAETEPETPPLTGLALRLAEALAEQFTVPKRGRATEATDWENPILDGMAERIHKGMTVHFIAEDGHPSFRDASPAEAVAVIMPLIDDALTRARHMTIMGRCKHCGAPWSGEHRMRCQFYVGPLGHRWVRTGVNGTFGGIDHHCACGGWFRQGGMAGHGDGSEDAKAVCPNADQNWRGPRGEAT